MDPQPNPVPVNEPEPTPAPEPQPAPGAPAPTQPTEPPAGDDFASLPAWAQKSMKELREEAAKYRTTAKTQAEENQTKLDAIAVALGLKEKDDPTVAAQAQAQELEATKAKLNALQVKTAIATSAPKSGASAEALMDSVAFMNKLAGLDPSADDFPAQLDAAIKEAVEANPALKADTIPPARSSNGPVGGGQGVPGQVTAEELEHMSAAEINKARKEGRLKNLLGG